MANGRTEITVDIKIGIPDETIRRAMHIIELWLDDNPDKNIIVELLFTDVGFRHKIHIESKVDDK